MSEVLRTRILIAGQLKYPKDTCNFTLAESNAARKLVAKKQMDKIGEFRIKIFDRAKNENMARYLWDTLIDRKSVV